MVWSGPPLVKGESSVGLAWFGSGLDFPVRLGRWLAWQVGVLQREAGAPTAPCPRSGRASVLQGAAPIPHPRGEKPRLTVRACLVAALEFDALLVVGAQPPDMLTPALQWLAALGTSGLPSLRSTPHPFRLTGQRHFLAQPRRPTDTPGPPLPLLPCMLARGCCNRHSLTFQYTSPDNSCHTCSISSCHIPALYLPPLPDLPPYLYHFPLPQTFLF